MKPKKHYTYPFESKSSNTYFSELKLKEVKNRRKRRIEINLAINIINQMIEFEGELDELTCECDSCGGDGKRVDLWCWGLATSFHKKGGWDPPIYGIR